METREKDVANLEIEKQKLKVTWRGANACGRAGRGRASTSLCRVPLRAPMHERSELYLAALAVQP